jgi:hypothetical protein
MTIYLEDMFDYNPETGWFTNRVSRGRAKEGDRAGAFTGHGYRRIIIDYTKHYEHHLAWYYVYGEYPDEIDHINGDGSDNRIANLRVCTRTQNNFNAQSTLGESGLRGAYLDKRYLQWYSKIQFGRQVKFLGNFNSPEEAHQAYLRAADEIAGEFAIHRRTL